MHGAHAADPVAIIHDDGFLRIEDGAHLHADFFDILGDGLGRVQRALVGLAAGVADETGAAAEDGDGFVTVLLHATQRHERQQIADVKAVRGRVKAAVEGLRRLERFVDGFEVAGLLQQAAPFEIGDEVGGHGPSLVKRPGGVSRHRKHLPRPRRAQSWAARVFARAFRAIIAMGNLMLT